MRKLFTLLFPLCCCATVRAQTWTGAAGSNWFNAANWNPAAVPSSSSAVIIPGGLGTYPTLTGNVVVAGLTMSAGSALHLGGYTFTDNGAVSVLTAVIDGGGNFTVAGAGSVDIRSSSLTTTTAITGYTGASTIYSNTFTGNTTLADAAAQASGTNYTDGNLFTGNLTITHASATADMLMGYGVGGAGDRVTGNCSITLSGGGTFYAAYAEDLRVDGNLTVTRTAAGLTNLYRSVGSGTSSGSSLVGGSFSYTNTAGGDFYFNGNNAVTVPVAGTLTISSTAAGAFQLYRLRNAAAGGTVSVANANDLYIAGDTLVATTVGFTSYTGAARFFSNSITGTTTLSDVAAQASGTNYTDDNLFNGNLNITHASATADMLMGYSVSGTGDRVTGNCSITLSGGGAFYAAYYEDLRVNGNLTVTRTAPGITNLYRSAGTGTSSGNSVIGGTFSYTNNAGGDFYFNTANAVTVPVGGQVSISSTTAGAFQLYRLKNSTAGGTVSVANASDLYVVGDTLVATTVGFTSYTGGARFYSNSITGTTTLSDAATQASGTNYTDGNLFTGNLSVTHASATADMLMGYGVAGNGDHVTGNCSITLSGGGAFYAAYYEDLRVDGNLTVTRTAAGITNLYRVAGSSYSSGNSLIGGAFSYTNNTGGDFVFNSSNATTVPVAGTLSVTSTSTGAFQLYRLRNGIAGGTVSVANASDLFVQMDTLLATVSFTNYTGAARFYSNSFTGTTTLSDAATQASSTNYTDGNLFNGNLSVTHASSSADMLMGYGIAGNGDRVTGNCSFTLSGSGAFYAAYYEDLRVDGNLTVNRTAAGLTSLYRVTGSSYSSGNSLIGGAFSYTNSAGGDFAFNSANAVTLPVGGAINISASSTGQFHLYRTTGALSGGSVSIANSGDVDLRNDTLRGAVSITGYTGALTFYDNAITGPSLVSDASTQSGGTNYIDGNLFAGRFSLVHSSPNNAVYEGFGSPAGKGNMVTGRDSIVNLAGAAPLYLSFSHTHRADSSFILNSAANSVAGSLLLGGGTGGVLRSDGAQPLSLPLLTLAKTGGATLTLQSPLTLTGTLTFTSGYLAGTATNRLIFASGAGHSGAGAASHVTGPVVKAGAQAFTFPLGNGSYYSPAGISAPATATDTFSAQYYPVPPHAAGYDSGLHDVSINHISRREYWVVNRLSGASNVFVTLGYSLPASGAVTNMSQLTVAHWYNNGSSTAWHDEGNGGTTGTNALGTVTSSNAVGSFSPFTLASTTTANPLPVVLSDFSARRVQKTAELRWTVQSEQGITGYGIQRSADGADWSDIGAAAAMGPMSGAHAYTYPDEHPLPGRNFYRLRIDNASGAAEYTTARLVVMDGPAGGIAVYPNPVIEVLHLSGSVQSAVLSDATGRTVATAAGDIDMRGLPAGLYLLRVRGTDGGQEAVRVVKE